MTWCPPICAIVRDLDGESIVSVLTKRTYRIRPDRRLVVAEEPLPLDCTLAPPAPGYDPSWRGEIEPPFKVATDVVVFGRAHAPGGSCTAMDVEVGLPHLQRSLRLRVTGDRRCRHRPGAAPLVSDPEPFETMPLGYDRAYGGVDQGVEFPTPADGAEALGMLMTAAGAYPRNPVGRGFVVGNHPERVEGLRLPNVERADQLLRPEQIVCGDIRQWSRQPLPAGLGWVDPGWFPRCVFGGALPIYPAPSDVAEVGLGVLPADFASRFGPGPEGPTIDYRLFNGASLGLVVPPLRGDEVIVTSGLCPEGALSLRLPGDRPRFVVRLAGRPLPAPLMIQTVGVLVDEALVYLVWRASARLPPEYTPRMASLAQPDLTGLEDLEIEVS